MLNIGIFILFLHNMLAYGLCALWREGTLKIDNAMIKKVFIGIWIFTAVVILGVFSYFYAIVKGHVGEVPDTDNLANIEFNLASQLFTADSVPMGTWALKENRVFAEYEEISPDVIKALIATEDVRFTEHSGIDLKALMRAGLKNEIFGFENAGGGSTITQQLAKQIYTENVSKNKLGRIQQKTVEWVIAVELERQYTKEEIITYYLNKYDFGNNAVGIKSAANIYFSTSPAQLKIEEAATLVGMCKNSSLYNPRRFPDKTKTRRNVVFMQMEKAGFITEAEKDSLSQLPLVLRYNPANHNVGVAPYFREYLRTYMTAGKPVRSKYRGWQKQQFFDDSLRWADDPLYGWCNKNKKSNGEPYNIYTDGLRIYTTIDSRLQRYLEEAVQEYVVDTLQPKFYKNRKGQKNAPFSTDVTDAEVKKILEKAMRDTDRYRLMKKAGATNAQIEKAFNTPVKMSIFTYEGNVDTVMTPMDSIKHMKFFLRAGTMSIDPVSGGIKAYVGGTNFRQFKYDMAGMGRRQVGSTIKPFLYSLAMENGFSPCDETQNVPQTIVTETGKRWTPKNSSNTNVGETVTLKWGLQKSNNWISAYLMSRLNAYSFKKLINEFGLKSQDIAAVPSLCLGICDASVMEMVYAYTAFINKGMRKSPLLVTKIEDSSGNVIAEFSSKANHVISEESTYKMIDMLRAVIDGGTGARLRSRAYPYKITADMGGKTGTTQNNSDGWFIGFTPSLITGCWVGGEERSIHFSRMKDGQAAATALPIYGNYMKKVYADKTLPYSQDETFDIPEDFDPCESLVEKNKRIASDASGVVDWIGGEYVGWFDDGIGSTGSIYDEGFEDVGSGSEDGFDDFLQ